MPQTRQDPAMLTFSQLRTRGWTQTLIRTFLGEPDLRKPNPHYRKGAPMKLYALVRIEATEARSDWRAAAIKARRRSDEARLRAQNQAQDLVFEAQDMPITLQAISAARLLDDAIKNYNLWQRKQWLDYGFGVSNTATLKSSPAFLHRIQVNYARHHLTDYDRCLEQYFGRAGVKRARTTLRRRIYAKIAAVFPWLEDECARQLTQRRQREQGAAHMILDDKRASATIQSVIGARSSTKSLASRVDL